MWWVNDRIAEYVNLGLSRGWPSRGLRLVALLGVFAGALVAAGCTAGFQPLHGSSAVGGSTASEKFAAVEFSTIPGRVGQRIRNELIFAAHGGGDDFTDKRYRLDIAVREGKQTSLVNEAGNSSEQIYTLDATFRLMDKKTGKLILTGNSAGRASIVRFGTIFSNVRALRDAQDRAARTIATDLKARLQAFLATQA